MTTTKESSTKKKRPVAVVTGAGRGLGLAFVNELIGRGYTVVAVVRTIAHVRELFKLSPEHILPLRCDVSEASTETTLKDFLDSQVETVDLLINNAGHGATGYGISGLVYKELDAVLQVHCYGPIRCTRACLDHLRRSENASIINISSRFASMHQVANKLLPDGGATYPYRIGKAALNMLTSCLSVELEGEGIRVFSVDPGKVKTRFGPKDADLEPQESARAVIDLVKTQQETGQFLHASGEKVPW